MIDANTDSEKLVSIIVACHNGAQFIDQCFEALVHQTYCNIEIVVCDDCSSDESYQKLLQWSAKDNRFRVLRNGENLYAGATRNNCIENSRGDYLMVQDIDDISVPDRTATLVAFLENHPYIDFASSAMISFDTDVSHPTGIMRHKDSPTKYDFLWNLPFFNPATMFRRECIVNVGGFRVLPETKRMEDYDLFMRLYASGYCGINIDTPLYYYRLDKDNIGRRKFSDRVDEMRIRAYGFNQMGLMPLGVPFLLKPFIAYAYQSIKYRKFR